MRYLLFCFIIPSLLLSCNNGNEKPLHTKEQPAKPVAATTDLGDWYRRYTGTIAGQQVVVSLYSYGKGELRGSYYYVSKGILIDLYRDKDSSSGDHQFIYEAVSTSRADENDYHNNSHWLVTIKDDKVTGKWISGAKQVDIELREDYSGDVYRFEVKTHHDSLVIRKDGQEVFANASFVTVLPSSDNRKDDADFIGSSLVYCLGGNKGGFKAVTDYFLAGDKAYFAEYKETIDSSGTIDSNSVLSYTYDRTNDLSVIYNDRGWLVFELLSTSYTGGAHGMYGSSFICIDVPGRKVWQLGDMMNVDTPRLQAVIEQEAHSIFDIKTGKPLSEKLLVDTIPVTDNMYATHTGLVFTYTPYEIASYADGQVSFFIPFTRIMDMLKPEFKKRIGL